MGTVIACGGTEVMGEDEAGEGEVGTRHCTTTACGGTKWMRT